MRKRKKRKRKRKRRKRERDGEDENEKGKGTSEVSGILSSDYRVGDEHQHEFDQQYANNKTPHQLQQLKPPTITLTNTIANNR